MGLELMRRNITFSFLILLIDVTYEEEYGFEAHQIWIYSLQTLAKFLNSLSLISSFIIKKKIKRSHLAHKLLF